MKKAEKAEKKDEIQELREKVQEFKDAAQRIAAEFDNYRKRQEKEQQAFREKASAKLIEKLLPVLDSLELALKNTEKTAQFIDGMKVLYAQFADILHTEGLEPIKAEGKVDPYLHEVLLTVPSEKEEGTILEELQKGYKFKGEVLRHSKVKAAKKKDNGN